MHVPAPLFFRISRNNCVWFFFFKHQPMQNWKHGTNIGAKFPQRIFYLWNHIWHHIIGIVQVSCNVNESVCRHHINQITAKNKNNIKKLMQVCLQCRSYSISCFYSTAKHSVTLNSQFSQDVKTFLEWGTNI